MDSISIATSGASAIAPDSVAARDDIMNAIASQAANVRRTFEANSTSRKHTVSSATAAAAHHMASLNRKRKLEHHLKLRATVPNTGEVAEEAPLELWNKSSRTFHSPIASFTRPEKTRAVSSSSGSSEVPTANRIAAQAAPRVSDGIVLKSTPHDITVTYNDVVCGKGKTTSSLVGNQRYKVWVELHKNAFAKAPHEEDRRQVACSVVNSVSSSLPPGRFLSLEIHTGLWYDVGYERAVGITLETLKAETGVMKGIGTLPHPPIARQTKSTTPRVFASKAA